MLTQQLKTKGAFDIWFSPTYPCIHFSFHGDEHQKTLNDKYKNVPTAFHSEVPAKLAKKTPEPLP
jgi:hypothetical protein